MLDISALTDQVGQMVEEWRQRPDRMLRELDLAVNQFVINQHKLFELTVTLERNHTSLMVPRFGASSGKITPLSSLPDRLTVAATDGSQIYPDRHEMAPCYLINIGYVLLHYGVSARPLLNSKPMLYYQECELQETFDGRRSRVTRETVSLRRAILELTELAELSTAAIEEGYSVVAFADGSLILWNLEGRSRGFREGLLAEIRDTFEHCAKRHIPMASFISRPGSREVTNALRIGLCKEEAARCAHCPWKTGESEEMVDTIPCGAIETVNDAMLFGQILAPGERSGLFGSGARINEDYGDHCISFFYLNVGDEVVRIEVPEYVAANEELLNLVHNCAFDQALKGRGYPVCLSEAHEQAVVRAADREAFYGWLQAVCARNGLPSRLSAKQLRKRHAPL